MAADNDVSISTHTHLSPAHDDHQEERHTDPASFVGRYVQVEYPSVGLLNGLVTGYYREEGSYRIDYCQNSAGMRYDVGFCIEGGGGFMSKERKCKCSMKWGEWIGQSSDALEYLPSLPTKLPQRSDRVGYMLGKILKADWGQDGVFLGIVSLHGRGNRFRVLYADEDDEWGTFKEKLTVLDLEDSGQRKVSWFDVRWEDLLMIPSETTNNSRDVKNEEDSTRLLSRSPNEAKTASLAEDMAMKVVLSDTKKERTASGAFTSAFLQSSGIHSQLGNANTENVMGKVTVENGLKQTAPKRSFDQSAERVPTKKTPRTVSGSGPKRGRSAFNNNTEQQPEPKKPRKRLNKKDCKSTDTSTRPPWLSESPAVTKDKEAAAAEPEGPRAESRKEEVAKAKIEKQTPSTPKTPASKKQKAAGARDTPFQARRLPPSVSPHPVSEKTAQVSQQASSPQKKQPDTAPPSSAPAQCSETPCKSTAVLTPNKPRTAERSEEGKKAPRQQSTPVPSATVTSPTTRKPAAYSSVEIGLEMQNLEMQLENLTQSREKIAKATNVAVTVAHCGGAKRVIDAVLLQIQEPVGAERRIALFYLLDSVLHYAYKDKVKSAAGRSSGVTVVFLDLVESKLKEIVETLSIEYESYTKLEKVLELWKERQMFSVEVLDSALQWVRDKANRHARSIEDDNLKSKGLVPYYVRTPHGPKCHRLILSKVFATIEALSEYLPEAERFADKRLRKYQKSDWDAIDKEIETAFKAKSRHNRFGPVVSPEGPKSGHASEEGEIPEHPPLPPYPPPEDDGHFFPPLPPEPSPDDPNFVPPLPTSPPPVSPHRVRYDPPPGAYHRYGSTGGFPNYHPPMYNERSVRSGRHPLSRGPAMDPRLHPVQRPSCEREYEDSEWYRESRHYPGPGRNDVYSHEMYGGPPPFPRNHAHPMQRLPPPIGNNCYPYPPQPWPHGRPSHHHGPYPMRNQPRRW